MCKAYGKTARTVFLVHESLHVPLWLRYELPQTVLCLNGFLSAIGAWYDKMSLGTRLWQTIPALTSLDQTKKILVLKLSVNMNQREQSITMHMCIGSQFDLAHRH